jgi:hypothetical protein
MTWLNVFKESTQMIHGTLSLKHPALNIRPAFRRATQGVENGTLILFENQQKEGLSAALEDACHLNSKAGQELPATLQRYGALKADRQNREARMELQSTKRNLTGAWQQLADSRPEGLRTAATLAAQASSHLGPVIMTGFKDLGQGMCKIALHSQTTKEGLINGTSEFSPLTGDHYSNRREMSVQGGEVVTDQAFVEPKPSAEMLVDTTNGIAVLHNQTWLFGT